MAVRRVNGRYVVEFQQNGKRVFKRLPEFATKGDTQALETKLRREGWERSALGVAEEPTLGEAIQEWLKATHAGRKDKLNPARNAIHLEPFVRGKTLRQVGEVAREAAKQWANGARLRAGIAPPDSTGGSALTRASLSAGTINRRLDILRAASRWAWKQGLIAEDLSGRVPRLREENARQIYLSAAQVSSLAKSSPNNTCRAAIIIAAYSGLRASELLSLTTASISGRDTLMVSTSKSGKPRTVPIAKPLRPYLSALPLDCSYRLLIKWFHAARKKAGMKHVHFHDLRHSFASLFLQANNGNLFLLSKVLGHTSIQTTMRYSHLITGEAEKAMRKLR